MPGRVKGPLGVRAFNPHQKADKTSALPGWADKIFALPGIRRITFWDSGLS